MNGFRNKTKDKSKKIKVSTEQPLLTFVSLCGKSQNIILKKLNRR
jgi:hypothetical protein